MSVIKSEAVDLSVRGLTIAPPVPVPSAEVRLIAELKEQVEALRSELSSRDQEIQRLTASATAAFDQGRAEGIEEGRQSAEDHSAALIRTVADTAARGLGAFKQGLTGLEDAAGGLAALALGRIVGQTADRQGLIIDTVRRAVGDLFAGSVVLVEVSQEDFADPAPLRAVLPKGCEVHVEEGLASGACRLKLRMGEVDLELQDQVARLRAILDPTGAPGR